MGRSSVAPSSALLRSYRSWLTLAPALIPPPPLRLSAQRMRGANGRALPYAPGANRLTASSLLAPTDLDAVLRRKHEARRL
jgi:hypothetical protein